MKLIKYILSNKREVRESILGLLCVYAMIGLLWFILYMFS